jgi:hypothetical protein
METIRDLPEEERLKLEGVQLGSVRDQERAETAHGDIGIDSKDRVAPHTVYKIREFPNRKAFNRADRAIKEKLYIRPLPLKGSTW